MSGAAPRGTRSARADAGGAPASVEIERKYLLRSRPAIPEGAEVWQIEQGYLPDAKDSAAPGGRLRRITHPDGRVACFHTVKEGAGLMRTERERAITEADFRAQWPHTASRRLRKTRHRVREGKLMWEIDIFDGIDLILAEVELPSHDAAAPPPAPPAWLAPHIDREVTDDPTYTNFAIATRGVTRSMR